ncbi:hypothetical protein C0991_006768 [Blastosporella zonata]|nr:hypothetical protein C0991_006768 [Blastosporella zonata]
MDTESKGYRIYWPKKRTVTIERDVYFNEKVPLNPENVQFEADWDLPDPNISQQSSTLPIVIQSNPNVPRPPAPPPIDKPVENVPKKPENASKSSKLIPDTENDDLPPDNPPHLRKRRDSLQGLPQFDEEQYGRGLRTQNQPKTSGIVEQVHSAFVTDLAEVFEPGGARVEESLMEAFQDAIEAVLSVEGDEPSVQEALGSDK